MSDPTRPPQQDPGESPAPASPFSPVEEVIAAFARGEMVLITDDEDRENEGDLAIAGEFVTPAAVNFFATHGRGLICLAMAPDLVDRFGLPLMVPQGDNRSGFGTGFTVSVEARDGVTTGISAADRARTVQVLCDPRAGPDDLVMPGHMFPLRARAGGVLERRGQTEAGVDLARLAGLTPAALICEVMNADGSMARVPDLATVAARHRLKMTSVEHLAQHRRRLGHEGPLAEAAQ